MAHRFLYEQLIGPVEKDLVLDHYLYPEGNCIGPRCVNPEHLRPITNKVNVTRSPFWIGNKTHCRRGHELTDSNLYKSKNPTHRVCAECARLRNLKFKGKNIMSMLGPYASYNAEMGWASWEPNREFVGIFDRHSLKPKGVIHVGMWDFVEHECYTKLFGTNVVGVEANPYTFNTMSKPVADKYKFKAYNYAAYFMDGSSIDISLRGGESSIFDHGSDTVQVPTITLDTLIEQEKIDMSNFDFLNIDAEGAELVVLLGIEENLKHINYIDLEASYEPRHSSGITYAALVEYLGLRGFQEVEKSDSFDTLGWGDVFFVRK